MDRLAFEFIFVIGGISIVSIIGGIIWGTEMARASFRSQDCCPCNEITYCPQIKEGALEKLMPLVDTNGKCVKRAICDEWEERTEYAVGIINYEYGLEGCQTDGSIGCVNYFGCKSSDKNNSFVRQTYTPFTYKIMGADINYNMVSYIRAVKDECSCYSDEPCAKDNDNYSGWYGFWRDSNAGCLVNANECEFYWGKKIEEMTEQDIETCRREQCAKELQAEQDDTSKGNVSYYYPPLNEEPRIMGCKGMYPPCPKTHLEDFNFGGTITTWRVYDANQNIPENGFVCDPTCEKMWT